MQIFFKISEIIGQGSDRHLLPEQGVGVPQPGPGHGGLGELAGGLGRGPQLPLRADLQGLGPHLPQRVQHGQHGDIILCILMITMMITSGSPRARHRRHGQVGPWGQGGQPGRGERHSGITGDGDTD